MATVSSEGRIKIFRGTVGNIPSETLSLAVSDIVVEEIVELTILVPVGPGYVVDVLSHMDNKLKFLAMFTDVPLTFYPFGSAVGQVIKGVYYLTDPVGSEMPAGNITFDNGNVDPAKVTIIAGY